MELFFYSASLTSLTRQLKATKRTILISDRPLSENFLKCELENLPRINFIDGGWPWRKFNLLLFLAHWFRWPIKKLRTEDNDVFMEQLICLGKEVSPAKYVTQEMRDAMELEGSKLMAFKTVKGGITVLIPRDNLAADSRSRRFYGTQMKILGKYRNIA